MVFIVGSQIRRKMLSWICLIALIVATQMSCSSIPIPMSQTKPMNPTDYETVPFSKLASGAFVDEHSGKAIRLQCSFWAQGPQFLPFGLSQSIYIGFGVAGPGGYGADGSGLWIDVVIPKEQSALVFELKPGEDITITGVAQRGIRGGRATLYIEAHELKKVITRRKQKRAGSEL